MVDLTQLSFLKSRLPKFDPRPWPKDANMVETIVAKTVQFRNRDGNIISFNKGEKITFSMTAWDYSEYSFYGLGRGIRQTELEMLVQAGHLMVMEPK